MEAGREAAVRLALEETGVNLAVYATSAVQGAEIVLTYEGRKCFREQADLSPEQVYSWIR